ncbi:hypothetical protein TSMEX_005586 [Taenia solium]|eukprot:TsM_000593100 transcript=TsM_000593100 gene=TsM_000593100
MVYFPVPYKFFFVATYIVRTFHNPFLKCKAPEDCKLIINLKVVCGAPIRSAFAAKLHEPLSALDEENPLAVSTTEVAKYLTGGSMRDADGLTRADSVPDQPLLVAISTTSLVMQWSVSIASNARFLVGLYRDADLVESFCLPSSVRQYIFQKLQPFTLYSGDLAICTGTECGPPSAMAFAATWPDS